ncbi:MAG: M48 family metallopeptidase [Rhodobacteraceae bacterium]|nr:M48 family metallopeptidase [Paracoccaceae bacterium]MCW9043306.1 M48 family metallopeptidase [Pseudopelagicola sp.]
MAQHFLHGFPAVPVVVRTSSRARRISLRVSRLDGRVTLTLPRGVREAEGLEFLTEKEEWVRKQLSGRAAPVRVGVGSEVLLEGRRLQVVQGEGRRIQVAGGEIAVPGAPERFGVRVQVYLKELARARLGAASDRYAARLGLPYSRITLRDTRSRWGSCSSRGALMYSWRLIMAPSSVLEYVAGHEVAHLREMNHGPQFWELVEEIHGPYEVPRRWLREHGEELHRYHFAD